MEIIKSIIEHGAHPDHNGIPQLPAPVYYAVINCDIEVLRILEQKRCDFTIKQKNGTRYKDFYDVLPDILLYHYSGHPEGARCGDTNAICLGC